MTREATNAIASNLAQRRTRPVMIMFWEHSGVQELISLSGGRVKYEGQNYMPGKVRFIELTDDGEVNLAAIATNERISEVEGNTWRNGICKIWVIPALATDDEDTAYTAIDAKLVMDGVIQTSFWRGKRVLVTAVHVSLDGNRTPRNTADEFCSYLNPPGTILAWEGDKIVLEAPR